MNKLFTSKIFLKQFLSFFTIIFTTFLSISFVILTLTEDALQKQTLSMAESYRNQVGETIDRWLTGRIYNIKSQALYLSELEESDLHSSAITKIISSQLQWDNNYYNIIIIDEKGDVINSLEGPHNINLADRDYVKKGLQGKSTITQFFKDKKDGIPIMAIGEPIYINNKPKYVLAGLIKLKRFQEIAESLRLGDLGHTYLVDTDGILITNSSFIEDYVKNGGFPNKDKYKLTSTAVKNVINKQTGTGIYQDFMNEEVLGAYAWLDKIQAGLLVEFKANKVMAPLNELNNVITILGTLVAVLGIFLAFLLSRRIIRPIELLIKSANSITAQNYQAPIKVKTDSELDVLINQFNHMQAAIRIREELLEKTNQQLRTQRAEAVEANLLKSQFLANMSHELRTPLNSIIGFTTRVLKKTSDILPEIQRENLTIVKDEAQHLLELINNLLDFSKIEAGKMEVHNEPLNLIKILEETGGMVKNLMEGKAVQYQEKLFNTDFIPIHSDRVKLKQILINLLSNAFKYSEKGTVSLSIEKEGNFYRLSVADEGVGIAPENLQNIFDEFRQVDGSYTRKVGGTGLGLSITKRLVTMLGGSINVASTIGVGSCFTVLLPIENQEPPVTLTPGDDADSNVDGQITIVCVDDDANVQRLYRQYLDQQGYKIVALDGQDDILTKITELKPSLIILDIILPVRDGWEILSDLKDNPLTKHIPVIMASVLNEKNLAYKMKADEFLVKPVSQEELIGAITNCIDRNGEIEVLVADDDENYLNLMGQFLKESSISYQLARNGSEALELITKKKPHVILLDIMMPHRDGFDVLEEMNKRPDWKDISVIVVTAKHLSKAEKDILYNRTNYIIEKSGLHIENVMDILIKRIKEKTDQS